MSDLATLRKQYMQARKVVCTGNPNNPNLIASGIKQLFPNATFLHKSNGWDLSNLDAQTSSQLKDIFKKHNTFINASWISNMTQVNLLNICNDSCKFCDVVNIGSTHEYTNGGMPGYADAKIALRDQSLALNTFRFKTVHLMLGGIKRYESQNSDWLTIDEICNTIVWTLEQRYQVPLMCIDQPKEPW
jgi:hypothetical protein